MANRVTIYIHNQSYNFLAEEDASYLQQCADIVNKEMDEAMSGTTISSPTGGAGGHERGGQILQGAGGVRQPPRPAQAGPGRERPPGPGTVRGQAGGAEGLPGRPPPSSPRQSPPSPPAKRDNPWNCWPRRVPGGPPGRRPSQGRTRCTWASAPQRPAERENFTWEQLEEGVAYCHLRG